MYKLIITKEEAKFILDDEIACGQAIDICHNPIMLRSGAKLYNDGKTARISGYSWDGKDVYQYFQDYALDPVEFTKQWMKQLRSKCSEMDARKQMVKILNGRNYSWIVDCTDDLRSIQHHYLGASKKINKTTTRINVTSGELLRLVDKLKHIVSVTEEDDDGCNDEGVNGFRFSLGMKRYDKYYNADRIDKCRALEYVPLS